MRRGIFEGSIHLREAQLLKFLHLQLARVRRGNVDTSNLDGRARILSRIKLDRAILDDWQNSKILGHDFRREIYMSKDDDTSTNVRAFRGGATVMGDNMVGRKFEELNIRLA